MVPAGTMVGAGDIGVCGNGGAEATARLLDSIGGTVFTTGDNAYMTGTAAEFRSCYEPSWGRHRSRMRPCPGNHEYGSGGGAYFNYFGANAGPGGAGYYSYNVGPWRVYALNSEVPSGPGSAQAEWLRQELALQPAVLYRRLLASSSVFLRPQWRQSGHAGPLADPV